MAYDHSAIERRWQDYWDEHKCFAAELDPEKPKYYVLDMFPYPSGSGLHVGHPEGYTATDILARYKRMKGFAVLHPMGWDAFGLPAEQYAIKTGTHPAERTEECVINFRRQLKMLGFSYDWDREVNTTDPKYVKWTQWIFLQIWNSWYDTEQKRARPIQELPIPADVTANGEAAIAAYRDEHRLAYMTNSPVNWCPELRIVLANEEVAEHVDAGRTVVRKPMRQWSLRITHYAQRLLDDLDQLNWPASVLEMQRNWIGRSEGAQVRFDVVGHDASIEVFTTRPDTIYGATYMVLAPEHPLVDAITSDGQRQAVAQYVAATAQRTERDRQTAAADAQKTGVDTGARAKNPFTGEPIPVFISDYVLMGYGTGAIMAVPGHDARDHAFARAFDLPIKQVVAPASGELDTPIEEAAFTEDGVATGSGPLDGLETPQAIAKAISIAQEGGFGQGRVTYKLRDWLFSRQRYWGEPFPLVHRPDGRVEAVAVDELPVELPAVDDFSPPESGEPPLSKATQWRELPDGSLREVNTMPQWAGSCWYYLRYLDPHNEDAAWSKEAEQYWMPVDIYVGGAEHAVLHLLYARFWHKILFDLGHVSTVEPFARLVNQGMVLGATYVPTQATGGKQSYLPSEVEQRGDAWFVKATGEPVTQQWDKMSKSRGNVVNPDDVVREHGADTLRLYEMFMGPLEHSAPWQPEGVVGCHKFLARVHRLFFDDDGAPKPLAPGEGSLRQRRLLHQTIDQVTDRIDRMAFNTAISSMMVFARDVTKEGEALCRDAGLAFCLLLAPFAPHLAEEIWQRALGHGQTLTDEPWPAADPEMLVQDTWTLVLQINGKKRGDLEMPGDLDPKAREAVMARALEMDAAKRYLEGKQPKRVIYVPGKLVNLVV